MKAIAIWIGLLLFQSAVAMQPLADDQLSSITGQDGLAVNFSSENGIAASQLNWVTDDNGLDDFSCAGGVPNQHACTLIKDISIAGVGGDLEVGAELDVGSSGGATYMAVQTRWGRPAAPIGAVLGGLTFNTSTRNASAQSLGSFALQSHGVASLINRGGLFNSGEDSALFNFHSEGDLIYRQGGPGAPELSFGDLLFRMAFTDGAAAGHNPAQGRVGVDGVGFLLAADHADVELTFDLAFKANPTNFDTSGRAHLLRFGWQGGLTNAMQRVGSGGYGYGTYMAGPNTFQDFDGSGITQRSEGLNLLSQWDFDSDFALIIGEAGGNRSYVRFSDWRRFGGVAGPMFSFPVIFDVLQAGAAPQGLCAGPFTSGVANESSCVGAGGQFISSGFPAGEAAFGVLIRDAHLHAYSSLVEVVDPLAAGTVTPINWGVVLTYGKLDADIFMRPEGRASGAALATTDTGIRADITLLAQSPDAWRRANSNVPAIRATAGDGWRTNTHVLVADTNSSIGSGHNGVGFINGDIIYRARDLFVRVTDGDSAYPELPGGLWLQTDSLAQYNFRGIFGGGDLADLSYASITKVSLMDVNLQTSRFIFVLNPLPVDGTTGAAPIGFNGLLDFDGNAYIRVGEVSSPQSQFYVSDVSGRIGWKDGSLSFVSGQNTPDGLPQLAIRNDLVIGQSGHFGGVPGQPLVGTMGFGTEDFGRIAIPAGTWNSEVIMKIPN
jgi:hypothetical protein